MRGYFSIIVEGLLIKFNHNKILSSFIELETLIFNLFQNLCSNFFPVINRGKFDSVYKILYV